MAAMVRSVYSGSLRQFAVRMPTAIWRLTSSSSTVSGGDSKKPITPPSSASAHKQEATDTSTYKVKEYYSYNEYSYYDLENAIDAAGRRQIQPNPKEKYAHTDPWTINKKTAT